MKFRLFVLSPVPVLALALILTSCKPLSSPEVTSQDCTVAAAPANFTRIFIGTPAHGGTQSGASAKDPLDGTTAQKFDTILRSIAEGERPTWGTQRNIAPENLIVCIASGTFQTEGQYDTVFQFGHPTAVHRGFTVEKNWKIHGSGMGHTTLQLASFVPDNFVDSSGSPFVGGRNVVLETRAESASGVEVSDLTIDANHDKLSGAAGLPLDLAGIVLWSKEGGHWIHDVKVIGAAGDAGFKSLAYETFAVQIWGNTLDPHVSSGNLIENLTVTQPGRPVFSDSSPGGEMDGIVLNNASGEVRNSVVEGYFIAFGGWNMDHVSIHDNITRETQYGFNADSFSNNNITLQSNQFIHPHQYGIIMGGGFPGATFANWNVVSNVISSMPPTHPASAYRARCRTQLLPATRSSLIPHRPATCPACGAFRGCLRGPISITFFRTITSTSRWPSIFPGTRTSTPIAAIRIVTCKAMCARIFLITALRPAAESQPVPSAAISV